MIASQTIPRLIKIRVVGTRTRNTEYGNRREVKDGFQSRKGRVSVFDPFVFAVKGPCQHLEQQMRENAADQVDEDHCRVDGIGDNAQFKSDGRSGDNRYVDRFRSPLHDDIPIIAIAWGYSFVEELIFLNVIKILTYKVQNK
jgi:hypothetical protein